MKRLLAVVMFIGLCTSCLEQYNPRPWWNKLSQERERAHSAALNWKLTPEGKVPPEALSETGQAAEVAFDAAKVFQTYCVACHKADGSGDPAMNSRNFTDPEWQGLATDAQIAAVIQYGVMNAPQHEPSLNQRSKFKLQYPTMVAWDHLLSPDAEKKKEQLADLVRYIRGFKK